MIQRWNIEGSEVTPDDEGNYVLYAHHRKQIEADRDWMRLGQELCSAGVSTKSSSASPTAGTTSEQGQSRPTSQTNREGSVAMSALRLGKRAGFADGLRACGCTEQTVAIRLAELEGKP